MIHNNKHIAIILPDSLQSMGLQCLLTEYFPPVEISLFSGFKSLGDKYHDVYDYYFIDSETLILNSDFFLPRKNKAIVLIENPVDSNKTSAINYLSFRCSLETIIEQLEILFNNDTANNLPGSETAKGLSAREIEVLQLIVKGITNKEIADKLRISLNTVLTHRKNITTKLGIKTVSGLTFYAIMNGLVSGEEIEI